MRKSNFTGKSRGLRGPVLSLPKDCLDFSLVNLCNFRVLCGFFSKVKGELIKLLDE